MSQFFEVESPTLHQKILCKQDMPSHCMLFTSPVTATCSYVKSLVIVFNFYLINVRIFLSFVVVFSLLNGVVSLVVGLVVSLAVFSCCLSVVFSLL